VTLQGGGGIGDPIDRNAERGARRVRQALSAMPRRERSTASYAVDGGWAAQRLASTTNVAPREIARRASGGCSVEDVSPDVSPDPAGARIGVKDAEGWLP